MPSIFLARIVRAAIVSIALLLSATQVLSAELPAGWRLDGDTLVFKSAAPLRMGGARYEFRSGTQLLGYPAQTGSTLRLKLEAAAPTLDLSVWAAGRRVDVTVAPARIAQEPLTAEPAIPATAVDPAARGPYRTERLTYRLASLVIPDFPEPIEVIGEVTAPVAAAGRWPLVLFLHGRHSTCYRGGPQGESSGDWPCPAGWRAVPSHTGYRYIADVLASRGYLAVSIAANGINAQDGLFADGGAGARSQLVRHHLARWALWNSAGGDPWGGKFRGRVDLRDVVLVGHSRGGEGVERAAIDSDAKDPWRLRGLVLIGPTAFGRQVAPGLHTTVILPFCDGDVSDLQGQQYVDIGRDLTADPALRTSVMAMGTNHNYYNTEWTPGLSKSPAWDDWFDAGDAQCGEQRERRLSPSEQQAVGLAYTAALVDLAIAKDRRSLPLLDGTRVKPRSIGRASTFVHAVGGSKPLLYVAGKGEPVKARALTARVCRGYIYAGAFDLRPGCAGDLYFELTPHWSPMAFMETAPPPRALEVEWRATGGSLRIPLETGAERADALDFRIAGEPGAPLAEFDVRVQKRGGGWVRLNERPLAVRSYTGPAPLGKVMARQVRASLRTTGVELPDVTAIELVPRSPTGHFWLLDVSAWSDKMPAPRTVRLPRVSVGDAVVVEGDAGVARVNVAVRIDGPVTKRAQLWVQLNDFSTFDEPIRGFPLVLEPGATSATIPFTYEADDRYSPFQQPVQAVLLARRNAVTSDLDGSILVEEDDPPPVLAAVANDVVAPEGGALTWTFRLSAPLAGWAFWQVGLVPVSAGLRELDTDDVPASFLADYGITPPVPAVPLSQLGLAFGLEFAEGEQEKTITIPIAADGVAEGAEGVALKLDSFGDPIVPASIDLTGTVPAN